MLPVYAVEGSTSALHQRRGSQSGAPTSGGLLRRLVWHHGSKHALTGRRGSQARTVLQGVVLLCCLASVWFMLLNARTAVLKSHGGATSSPRLAADSREPTTNAITEGAVGVGGKMKPVGSATTKPGIGRRMARSSKLPPLPGAHLKHLILVAGHAVYVGRDYREAGHEQSWFLEDYQQVPGEANSFLDHIRLGILEAARDPEAMLLFSGGETRLAAGPRSEGASYWVVAEAAGWFVTADLDTSNVRARTFTEEHARDSFENLLFSLCRFYELSGHYPDMVTVVSYNLKRDRFANLHRAALRFPAHRFRFVGNEVPPAATGAQAGEARTVDAFKLDPYGCHEGGELLEKKLRRDPFAVGPPHPSRCPDLEGLLLHCDTQIYSGPLPWDPD